MQQPTRVYTPGEAAAELGVTTQSLRRYAQHYAEVFEPVAQHAKQRVFTDEVVSRLRAAQALQQANKAPSIRAGLELIRDGLADAQELATGREGREPLAVLADTVRALTEEIVALRGIVEAQGEQLKALEPAKDDKAAHTAELERRNAYLEGELRRRDEQPAPRRPWWKVWEN